MVLAEENNLGLMRKVCAHTSDCVVDCLSYYSVVKLRLSYLCEIWRQAGRAVAYFFKLSLRQCGFSSVSSILVLPRKKLCD